MVDLALPRQLRAIGVRALGEAQARRSGSVEAEHVLLAILAQDRSAAAITLASAGLDYAGFEGALSQERERSLGAAGISPTTFTELAAIPRAAAPGWGASVRDLLRRADKPAAKDARPGALEIELAAAILKAPLGTVPRGLVIAGFERSELLGALSATQAG